jgi:hypothetical protein
MSNVATDLGALESVKKHWPNFDGSGRPKA